MSDTLKIDRELLERLAPVDPCYAHNGTIMVCWFCDRDNGHDELRLSDHANDCAWVAARALLDAPPIPRRQPGARPAPIQQSEVFAVDPKRMTLIGYHASGERRMAMLTASEWAQMEAWMTSITPRYRGEGDFECLMLARRILDERGGPLE